MIYGRVLKTNNRKFFKNTKIKKEKKGPVLTEPRSTATHIPYPIIKDHLSEHILSTEKAISDLYKSNKPTSLKIQSLSKNLDKLTTLNRARKTNTGIFRITKAPPPPPPDPTTNNPPQPARPIKRRIRRATPVTPIAQNQNAENAAPDTDDRFVVRRLFNDGDGDDDNTIIAGQKRQRPNNTIIAGQKRQRPSYLRQNPPTKKGNGIYDWMSLSDPTLKWK